MNQSGFAVPKERQEVTVHLAGGLSVEGTIFLESMREGMTLHQKIMAFLDDDHAFFPLTLRNGGETEFLQKKNITMVEVDYSADRERIDLAIGLMYTVAVTAFFADNTSLTGLLMADVPLEKARLSDCLNLPNSFLSLKANGTIRYVNKAQLLRVVYAEP